jgi:membrane associated rhomboid family serine protease
MVRMLILINGAVFLGEFVLGDWLLVPFSLDTRHPLQVWRYVTYLFLHDPSNAFHIFFNMFALWMFGSDMEDYFGKERFLKYYLFTGMGAGLCVTVLDLLTGRPSIVIGASGAVFGILLAFGIVYAERVITLLLFFVLPVSMKARHFVIIFGVLEFLFGVSARSEGSGGGGGVAHFAHLGGMAFGYLYLKHGTLLPSLRGGTWLASLRRRFQKRKQADDDRRMDDLLRKVNAQGIQSLTEEEKQFLHRMSRSKRWN